MQRTLTAATLSVGLIVGLASAASADDKDKDRGGHRIDVETFQIGLGSLAGWIRGAGAPGQRRDNGQYGLYLQKNTKTGNFSSAGAELKGNVPKTAAELTALAFDIPGVVGVPFENFDPNSIGTGANGYCGAGAPRFNVFSDGGTCFLGCIYGTKTQDPETGWWTIKFAPVSTAPGLGCGGTDPRFDGTVSGNITGIQIVFDEGIDVGGPPGSSPGNVVIDNITVNDKVVGKPRGDDD
jgi:hypothetical protein